MNIDYVVPWQLGKSFPCHRPNQRHFRPTLDESAKAERFLQHSVGRLGCNGRKVTQKEGVEELSQEVLETFFSGSVLAMN